ncbi:tetratricopeptide repeat protein [Prochlorococcus marinus]|jgi:tetratricopeptide (TPR) repeat protein|uniref:Uncharacterized protein n=1 Tax=Prochlorococcus marinus (strain MIT 9301) TaxID=167546 RepID=A3PAA3_PROM0|nr:hypothetical protein [Prochlorococcus marinus]ABO16678.1 Hypothetical protein P9301_00551 [Prochlorococcus marinus str. MIT 9301]
MKKIRPIFLLSSLIFLLSVPYEIFALNGKNVLDLERSRELLLDGYIQSDFDNHQLAIEYFTEAIRLNPNNFYAFFSRAYSRNKIQDIAGAWDDLNRVLEIDPNIGVALYNRAIVNAKLGHKFSSIRDYSKAINKNIELKNAYASRGILKSNIGDIQGACFDWQKASENNNEKATSWVQKYCLPNISEEFQKKVNTKVFMANARRKYFDGEIKEACNYYEQAKINGYKANNFRDKLTLMIITNPMCFVF